MITKDGYCTDCENTGRRIDGSPCPCRIHLPTFFDGVSCLDIPEQFQGIKFNQILVSKDMPAKYAEYLQQLHDDIVSIRLRYQNIAICSPVNTSKTILAYSCIEELFRKSIPTFPLFDILEIKRIMLDTDLCRKMLYEVEHPENLLKCPYLFVRVPRIVTWEIYETMSTLLDRRVRRGNSTIFLYSGSWDDLVFKDNKNIIKNCVGTGAGTTIKVSDWRAVSKENV